MEYLEETTKTLSISQSVQEWIINHLFEIILVIILVLFVIYKYANNEISLIKSYKQFVNRMYEKIYNLFGNLWLKSNMVGGAIKTKSVSINEEENTYDDIEEYDNESESEEENRKNALYI